MAIAYGATTEAGNDSQTSITFSSPNVSGANTIGIVAAFANNNTFTGVTWNGSAMTLMINNSGTSKGISLYYIVNPPAGVTNVVISRTVGFLDLRGVASFYTGVKQTGQPDATGSNSASTDPITTSVTVVANDSWALIAGMNNSNAVDMGTGGTKRSIEVSGKIYGDSNGGLAPGSRSIGITGGGAAQTVTVMASIAPAPVAANTGNFFLVM